MTPSFPSPARPHALVAVLALAAACASGGSGSMEAASASSNADGPTCQGDCWLEVENRLRNDAEVSTEFEPAVAILGIVRENQIETFHLEDFEGEHIEIWVRDTETREIIGLDCVRQFRRTQGRKQGRMVLGEGGPAGTSGC